MADKPPPHPPHQARHPGRGKVAPDKRQHYQGEQHARTMKRPTEPLHIAKHCLQPHPHPHKGVKPI